MRKNEIDIGKLILQKLKEKSRSIAWLAREMGCDDSNLGKTLKNNRYLYADLLFHISVLLEEDFFAYYSQELREMGITVKLTTKHGETHHVNF